jgi:hypothetical protein
VPVDVASFEEAALLVSPGVTGVGARAGAGESARIALVFPSAMVGAGLDVGAALASAANESLEDGSAALSGVGALDGRGVRFLAFECVWVAEVGEDATASILQRGGRVFETRDVATPMVRELGARLADLVSRQAAGDDGNEGASNDGARAGASFARALGAYALARWAAAPGSGTPEQAEDWAARAASMFAAAGEGMHSASPGAAALWVMVGSALPSSGDADGEGAVTLARGRAGEALVRALGLHEQASAPVAAMLAWAAAWRGGSIGDPDLVDRADAALRAAYARTATGEWVGLMPWAGWAEIEIAAARQRLAGGGGAIAAAAGLREMRD